MKPGDLITLLEQDGYYILIEKDKSYGFGNRWWKVQSLASGSASAVWTIEPRMVLVNESR